METKAPALPAVVQTRITRDVDRRLAAVSRFATTDAAIVPIPLIAPYNRRNYLALKPDHRLATIRTNLTKQITAAHTERHARRLAKAKAPSPVAKTPAPAPAVAPAPAPAVAPAPAPASRYVVPCASGCGRFLPAKSPRPVLVRCKTHTNKETQPSTVNAGLDQMIRAFSASASAA